MDPHADVRFTLNNLILQPTSLCNLNCSYCYLPLRRQARMMPPSVPAAIVDALRRVPGPVVVTWHSGEPLACGVEHFKTLLAPLRDLETSGKIIYAIQTNGTLLSREWCDLLRENRINVSVSIDGPPSFNLHRSDWSGRKSFQHTMRGISLLKEHHIPFTVIAVVGREALEKTREFYTFFADLSCEYLGINFYEELGEGDLIPVTEREARDFWQNLFLAWREHPVLNIREFRHAFSWVLSLDDDDQSKKEPTAIDLFPSINAEGDVVLISPEFLDVRTDRYGGFVVGNVLRNSLEEILAHAQDVEYVRDFAEGRAQCRLECPYFASCGGGCAANKFFEHGTTNATVTQFCQRSEQFLIDTVLELI